MLNCVSEQMKCLKCGEMIELHGGHAMSATLRQSYYAECDCGAVYQEKKPDPFNPATVMELVEVSGEL